MSTTEYRVRPLGDSWAVVEETIGGDIHGKRLAVAVYQSQAAAEAAAANLRRLAIQGVTHKDASGLRRGILSAMLIAAVIVGAALASCAMGGTVIIRDDAGGSIEQRLHDLAALRSGNTIVRIEGRCSSACTMLLALPNVCVTRSARLGFHGPASQYYGISLPPQQAARWTKVLADHYPARLRAWFLAGPARETMTVVKISGADAIRFGVKECLK